MGSRVHKPVLVPSFGVDDSDCKTLTMSTVIPKPQCLSRIMSSLDLLPPNSAVHTAQDGTRCWLAQLLGDIFPTAMLLLVSRTSKAKFCCRAWMCWCLRMLYSPSIKSLLTDCIAVMCSCQ
uniref:Uncharacterized protein n=1 Tax=Ditylenchus dipsaci TaxID=166011 RepID=A0A915CKV5_9BILA